MQVSNELISFNFWNESMYISYSKNIPFEIEFAICIQITIKIFTVAILTNSRSS